VAGGYSSKRLMIGQLEEPGIIKGNPAITGTDLVEKRPRTPDRGVIAEGNQGEEDYREKLQRLQKNAERKRWCSRRLRGQKVQLTASK